MAKGHKPKAGSRAFWPRKRAKRIYPRFSAGQKIDEPVAMGFGGYKVGMTQVVYVDAKKESVTNGQEITKPVTVLECPPITVAGIRTYIDTHNGLRALHTIWTEKKPKDLYLKTNISKKQKKNDDLIASIESQIEKLADIRLIVHTNPRETGFGKKKPELLEIPLGGDNAAKWAYAKEHLGKTVRASDIFVDGEYVDSSAVSTGKGMQGVVKRYGVKIRPRKHEKKRRHGGVLGVRNVARVLPGKIPRAGQHGFQTRTEFNKRIIHIGSGELTPKGGWLNYGEVKGDYIILEGSIPGPRKRFVLLRKGIRSFARKEPVEVKKIYMDSQQGN